MCFIVTELFKTRQLAREFSKKTLIAKKDMIVFKILEITKDENDNNNYYYSPYQLMRYIEGKKYSTKISFQIELNRISHKWKITIHRGFHSYINYNHALNRYYVLSLQKCKIIKMIVPKGAKYFINEAEIVSDTLIFPKIIPKK